MLSDESLQQPTDFSLKTYLPEELLNTPDLNKSIESFTEKRTREEVHLREAEAALHSSLDPDQSSSRITVLLLQVSASASYYSADQELMRNVPPVKVDISK